MATAAAKNAETELRYNTRRREREPVNIAALRVAELRRLFRARYGHVLPDDDAGRDAATHEAALANGGARPRTAKRSSQDSYDPSPPASNWTLRQVWDPAYGQQ